MGHEFVEMKNAHAAIEAYRKAIGMSSNYSMLSMSTAGLMFLSCLSTNRIYLYFEADVNRKDYRAWYGLGQAYELLSMHEYALYYYQHATSLRYVLCSYRSPPIRLIVDIVVSICHVSPVIVSYLRSIVASPIFTPNLSSWPCP